MQKDYAKAAEFYQTALKFGPSHLEWKELHTQAKSNAHAEVNVAVPEITDSSLIRDSKFKQ